MRPEVLLVGPAQPGIVILYGYRTLQSNLEVEPRPSVRLGEGNLILAPDNPPQLLVQYPIQLLTSNTTGCTSEPLLEVLGGHLTRKARRAVLQPTHRLSNPRKAILVRTVGRPAPHQSEVPHRRPGPLL
jgi:hypothetical protein